MNRYIITAGSVVKINGFPMRLLAQVECESGTDWDTIMKDAQNNVTIVPIESPEPVSEARTE